MTSRTAAAGRNWLLRQIPDAERALVLPHLEPVTLEPMDLIAEPGAPVTHVHFPETAVISLLTRLADGTLVENGTVGVEGVAGFTPTLGVEWTPAQIAGQIPGLSRRMEVTTFLGLLPQLPVLRVLVPRYVVYFLAQASQSLACNSVHRLEQRAARWLLMTHDRVPGDEFVLTQEILAQMLAVRRSGISVAAAALQDAGIIRYSRGRVTVLDRARLEQASCECYAAVREHRDRILGPPPE